MTIGRVPPVLITTVPFGDPDPAPRRVLDAGGVVYDLQPFGRRITEEELAALIAPYEVLIAGTEPITARVIAAASNLRLIARVGIGLDSVDLAAARRRGIAVTYTPEAPAPAVAELAFGLILNLCRHVTEADRAVRGGGWHRLLGRRLDGATVGILGVGRAGSRVARMVRGAFPGVRLLGCDLRPDEAVGTACGIEWVAPARLYAECGVISVHVPLTPVTRGMIGASQLQMMKPDALLVNTARGGIVDEAALAEALRAGRLGGAAIDVFEHEPYRGELAALPTCLLTCHMGSMTADCRIRMESEAAEEAVRWLRGEPLRQLVPEEEYLLRAEEVRA
ncbi:MAG: lactate dehydrogenase [Acidimicrobiia bacterium]|nr:lactate dehydrogenase [Acidimicrobiia bacterium]